MLQKALREYGAVSAESTLTDGSTHTADGSSERAPARIDVRRFPWIRPLAGDYAFDFERVAPLYSGNPASAAAWSDAIARVAAFPRSRQAIAGVLAAQQAHRGAPAAARDAAKSLADGATVAVVTGQQAGAFGGPLFTLLKAITAVQLAQRAAREQRTKVVAIFWVDAEDHDWNEIASCTVLDSAFQPRTVTVPPPDGAGERPVGTLKLDAGIERSLDELASTLGETEFTAPLIAALRAAYKPGTGVADAFATWIESLLGTHGLIVFDASDAAAKPLVADLFSREVQNAGRTSSLAAAAGETLASKGHQPQVTPHPDNLAIFHVDHAAGVRRPIKRNADGFVAGERTFSAAALLAEASSSPDRFSPNVLLRPIVQDTLFPTVCYVAGPSELAYLGQLRGVYESFGVPMPLIYPRATATLVDSAAARFLSKYDVPLESLQPQDESGLNRLLESQIPQGVEAALKEAQDAMRRVMGRVVEELPSVDPTLAGAARTTLAKMEHDLQSLHNKMIQAAKKKDETLRRQFARAQAQVFPLGHPQERTLGFVYFLNRYGPAVIDRLLADLPLDLGQHWIVTV
jgi:bacillithiol biosynthesis cysteine-adding enzyme BshC